MQAKTRVWPAVVAVLFLTLLLAACGGGTSGKTWFNLPSAKVEVKPNGTASYYGVPIPVQLLAPAQIEMLQSLDAQQIEARFGYNGIHASLNGENLPYLAWDAESEQTLREIVTRLPGLPQPGLIATALPWLRTVGAGVKLELPPAAGAAVLDIPRWQSEAVVTPAVVDAPTLGPLEISNLTFDAQGNGSVGSVPLSSLGAPVTLPPAVLQLVNSLGIQNLQIDTEPDGLHLIIGDRALPTIAYDADSLGRVMSLVKTMMPNLGMDALLDNLATALPGADLKVAVSFNGEPAGEANLKNLNVAIGADGSVTALGIPLPGGPLLPASLLQQLEAANLQNVQVNLSEGGLNIANNGMPFPAISWAPEGVALLKTLAPALAGISADQVQGVMDVIGQSEVGLNIALPGAEATAPPAEGAAAAPTFAPVDLGDFAPPIIQAALQMDAAGNVTRIGNVEMADVASMGLPVSIALPANIVDILKATGAKNLAIVTNGQGHLDVALDGTPAISLDFDVDALRLLLATLKPMLNVELLNDAVISQIIDEQVMPLAPGAQVNIAIALP